MPYAVLFAPDGEHYQELKKGSIGNMTDFFNGPEVTQQIALNKFAKFRLINLMTKITIGERPK